MDGVSQKEKDKYHMISHIWNLIQGTNEFHRKETHGLREKTCGCHGEGGGSGMDWKSGVNRCKLAFGVDKQWDPTI